MIYFFVSWDMRVIHIHASYSTTLAYRGACSTIKGSKPPQWKTLIWTKRKQHEGNGGTKSIIVTKKCQLWQAPTNCRFFQASNRRFWNIDTNISRAKSSQIFKVVASVKMSNVKFTVYCHKNAFLWDRCESSHVRTSPRNFKNLVEIAAALQSWSLACTCLINDNNFCAIIWISIWSFVCT